MDLQAEIVELKERVDQLEKASTGLRTAFIKLVPLVEETRLRVSAIEDDVAAIRSEGRKFHDEMREFKTEMRSFRKEVPGIVADAMRDVLKHNR